MNSLRTAKRFWFPLLGLWVLLYASFSLLKPPLLDGTDSVQAEAAREMAVNGNWITPHLDGVRYLAVSPLLTWSTALSFKLFGVSDWAARLPLAISALALFIFTLSLGSRLFLTPVAGFYAALLLITSAGIFLFAHLLHPQVLTTLWITAAIYFFWRSTHHEHASLGSAVGFAAACALGTLSQGLFGVAVPIATVLLFLAITRNLRHLLRWHPVLGVLVFVVIVAPWHVAVHRANAIHPHLTAGSDFYSAPLVLAMGISVSLDHALVHLFSGCIGAPSGARLRAQQTDGPLPSGPPAARAVAGRGRGVRRVYKAGGIFHAPRSPRARLAGRRMARRR